MNRLLISLLGLLAAVLFVANCGSSEENRFQLAVPALTVSSPTTTAATTGLSPVASAMLRTPVLGSIVRFAMSNFSYEVNAAEKTDSPGLSAPNAGGQENKDDAKGDPSNVAGKVGNLANLDKYRANCFGPSLTTTLQNNASTGSARNLPGGDLLIMYSTASNTDTTPCSVAEVDALIASQPGVFNKVFKLVIAMLAKANNEKKSLPDVGGSITVEMPTVTDTTFTEAKLERLSDGSDGFKIYKASISGTIGGKSFTVTLKHSPHNDDNSEFTGFGQAVIPYTPTTGSGTHRGLSIAYEQIGGTQRMVVKSASNRATSSTDFFATNGDVDFSKSAFGEDGHFMVMQYNNSTKAGTLRYGWMAGASDGATRVFEVTTDGSTGRAFAGYGAALTSLTATSANWGTKFYCDWTVGLSGGTSQTKLQKQTFAVNSSGKFVVSADSFRFHTSSSCDASGSYAITNGPSFLNGTVSTNLTNSLVAASSNDVPAIATFTGTIPR